MQPTPVGSEVRERGGPAALCRGGSCGCGGCSCRRSGTGLRWRTSSRRRARCTGLRRGRRRLGGLPLYPLERALPRRLASTSTAPMVNVSKTAASAATFLMRTAFKMDVWACVYAGEWRAWQVVPYASVGASLSLPQVRSRIQRAWFMASANRS